MTRGAAPCWHARRGFARTPATRPDAATRFSAGTLKPPAQLCAREVFWVPAGGSRARRGSFARRRLARAYISMRHRVFANARVPLRRRPPSGRRAALGVPPIHSIVSNEPARLREKLRDVPAEPPLVRPVHSVRQPPAGRELRQRPRHVLHRALVPGQPPQQLPRDVLERDALAVHQRQQRVGGGLREVHARVLED
eukprot:30342-Pelagococcus_subviridis.AAC.9